MYRLSKDTPKQGPSQKGTLHSVQGRPSNSKADWEGDRNTRRHTAMQVSTSHKTSARWLNV